MPLTLILGPANSAKAGEVLGAFATATQRDAVLVLPTAADADHYDRELAADGVLLGRSFTFSGLASEIARRVGVGVPRLTAHQRQRVLRRALLSVPADTLGSAVATPGFADAVGAMIAELIRRRVTPQRLSAALRAWETGEGDAAGPARALAASYHAYVRELDRLRRVDTDLFAWQAINALVAAPGRWGRTPVFVYGFDDLTALERAVIETLAGIAEAHVTVSLTYEPGRHAFAARAAIAHDLQAIATVVRSLPADDEHYAPDSRAGLHHLERQLFEPAPARIDPGDGVRLLEAGGELAEAELVGAQVLDARRSGVPPEEIVVVCRSLARSGGLLSRVLTRYGLPVACERSVPVSHTALGRALLGLARCALTPREASAEDLLAYLRGPGIVQDIDSVDGLEVRIRRHAVRTAADARRFAEMPLSEVETLAGAEDPPGELARHVQRLLVAPRSGRAEAFDDAGELEARAAAVVLRALQESADLGERLSGPELIELIEGLAVRTGPTAHGEAILIAEPLSIRARRFRVVVVTGLCEGEFPAPGSVDPFLDDEHRRDLAHATGLVLGEREDPLARERYLLYSAVSRATERLVLSYRSSDEEGRAISPSPFVEDIADLFEPGWFERRRRRLLADVVWNVEDAPTASDLRCAHAALAAANAVAVPEPISRTLGAGALAHVRHRAVVSGGALESFAACPVHWLVERQLSPRPLEPDPEPIVRGTFMHAVLERLIDSLGGPVSEESLDRARELLDEIAAEQPGDLGAGRSPAVRAAIRRGIVADLRRYLAMEAADGCEWEPRAAELRFGFDGDPDSLPPVELHTDGEHVRLRGMIDRVDVDPAGRRAIVRDYKSGAARPERAGRHWLADHELQVGLYMIAVRRLLGLEPVAGFFQPLTGRDLRPRGAHLEGLPTSMHAFANDGFDAEGMEQLLEGIERDAVQIAVALRRGELTPNPPNCSRDGCRHPGICWAQ